MTPEEKPQELVKVLEGAAAAPPGPAGRLKITGLAADSRAVRPGDLFVALKGQKHDGHEHAADVARRGAAAILAERPLPGKVPVIVVPSTLAALSRVSANFYGHPSRGMTVAGVTGTNGKTTTTYMLESIFRAAGFSPGVIGTINYRWGTHSEKAPNTTPLSLDLQRLLARMKAAGVTHVAMEVSSHALALGRVEDVAFSSALFTNLTRDHMDFHKDMEAYFEAKARLFDLLRAPNGPGGFAIINRDDPWAEKFIARARGERVLTFALQATAAAFRAESISLTAEGTTFLCRHSAGSYEVKIRAVGAHNVYNALGAAAMARGLGLPDDQVKKGLADLPGVPGRLERVEGPDPRPFSVFVDYAHTDDALRNVLETLRPLTKGRLITVFGCGGDRDRTKRPLMGQVAVRLSDHAIVTSDNPRTEDPARILADIEAGILQAGGTRYELIEKREAAIEKAVWLCRAGDVVLIAGKGHETYQIFKDRTIDFDDREVARAALAGLP